MIFMVNINFEGVNSITSLMQCHIIKGIVIGK